MPLSFYDVGPGPPDLHLTHTRDKLESLTRLRELREEKGGGNLPRLQQMKGEVKWTTVQGRDGRKGEKDRNEAAIAMGRLWYVFPHSSAQWKLQIGGAPPVWTLTCAGRRKLSSRAPVPACVLVCSASGKAHCELFIFADQKASRGGWEIRFGTR